MKTTTTVQIAGFDRMTIEVGVIVLPNGKREQPAVDARRVFYAEPRDTAAGAYEFGYRAQVVDYGVPLSTG